MTWADKKPLASKLPVKQENAHAVSVMPVAGLTSNFLPKGGRRTGSGYWTDPV